MSIISCLISGDWACISDWGIGELISFLVFSVLLVGIGQFFYALYIARQLLKKNRGRLGQGFGTHAADTFVQLWYQEQSYNNQITESLGNNKSTTCVGLVAEQSLEKWKLVEIYINHSNNKKWVKAIHNFRNKVIVHALIFDLVHKYDDDPKLYKQFKRKS